jgi:3',5'-cyclic AMP phosphodiesterase CpdA
MSKDKQFVIAHLTDLHLTASDDEAKMNRTLKGMNGAFRRIIKNEAIRQADLIIVTGDVTDKGDVESWKIFWKVLKEDGLSEKVLVVPGNHDTCCMRARTPFRKREHHRNDLEKIGTGLVLGNQETRFPWAKEFGGRVAIFGLNSNNTGNISILTNARGRIGRYQLLSFAQKLYTHRDVPVKIVALHHSPSILHKAFPKKRGGKLVSRLLFSPRQMRRRHRRALLTLCQSQGVKLIAHGHVHKAHDQVVNGIRIVGAPPTTQPMHKKASRRFYQFYTYTIEGPDSRVNTKLKTIEV